MARHTQILVIRPVKATRPSRFGLYRNDMVRVGSNTTALLAPVPDANSVDAAIASPLFGLIELALSLADLALVPPARTILA